MVFWVNTITGPAWLRGTQSTAGTLGGLFGSPTWVTPTTQTASTTSTIYYQDTFSQTASTTMGLYNTPAWAGQWTAQQDWSLEQDRRWLAQAMAAQAQLHEVNRLQRDAVRTMAAPAIHRRPDPAVARARELLMSYLSDEQRRTFEEHGWFVVVGGRSGRRYRISGASYAGNVLLLCADNDTVEARFCGHCAPNIPLGDQLLAQKVMLEVDEPAYIALANRTPVMRQAA